MKSGFDALWRRLVQNPMEAVMPLAIFAATFVTAWVIRRLILRALNAWNARTESPAGRILYDALRGPTRIWILILAVHLALQSSDVPARYTRLSANVLLVLWILSLTIMCMRFAGNVVRRYGDQMPRSEEHTSELQSRLHLVCRLLLEKKTNN